MSTSLKRKRSSTVTDAIAHTKNKVVARKSTQTDNATSSPPPSQSSVAELSAQEILRRHFESQFGPLGGGDSDSDSNEEEDDDSDNSESGSDDDDDDDGFDSDRNGNTSSDEDGQGGEDDDGFSDISEEDAQLTRTTKHTTSSEAPEVFDYTSSTATSIRESLHTLKALQKSEKKSFMSHKIPTLLPTTPAAITANPTKPRKPPTAPKSGNSADAADGEGDDEALNLKNDLALQRLLKESHLLKPHPTTDSSASSSFSSLPLELQPSGKNRHRAIESRIQSLGGVSLTKHRMPVPMKYGILKARRERETKRIKTAKDGGIVLERNTEGEVERKARKAKEEKKRRENRGFGPAVGKFRNGALVLSKKDVREIEGPRQAGGGGRGGKKGGSGRGGKGKRR